MNKNNIEAINRLLVESPTWVNLASSGVLSVRVDRHPGVAFDLSPGLAIALRQQLPDNVPHAAAMLEAEFDLTFAAASALAGLIPLDQLRPPVAKAAITVTASTGAYAAAPTLTGAEVTYLRRKLERIYERRHATPPDHVVGELIILRDTYTDPHFRERLTEAALRAEGNNFMALDRLIGDLSADAPSTEKVAPLAAGNLAAPSLSAEAITALYERLREAHKSPAFECLSNMSDAVRDATTTNTDVVLLERLRAVALELSTGRAGKFAILLDDLAKPAPARTPA